MTGAKQLYTTVTNMQNLQLTECACRIKNSTNPSGMITTCIEEAVTNAYHRCVEEMEHDLVLEYTMHVSVKVVNYSLLRQMGAALAVVKTINRINRKSCDYGEPYYKVYLVGLSKITVKVKIKKRFGLFNQ